VLGSWTAPTSWNPRRSWTAFLVIAALLLAPTTALAAGPSTTSPESARKQNADRQKQVGAELNTATASEDQLRAELDRLDGVVRAYEAKAQEAEAEQARQLEVVASLRGDVDQAEAAADDARRAAAQHAVEAYMRPSRETATEVLAAKDPQSFDKMRTIVADVGAHYASILQRKQIAETLLRQKKAEADEAQAKADAASAKARSDYDSAARTRDQRVAVRDEMARRIEDLKKEQAELDKQEGQLSALIAQRQRAVAADPTLGVTAPRPTSPPTTTAPAAPPSTKLGTPTTKAPVAPPPTTAKPPPVGGGGRLAWPVNGVVTSGYGMRDGRMHQGIDIGVPLGTPIRASGAGVVFFSGVMSGYGNVILIDHGNGTVTLYAHQSQLNAAEGARVGQGQVIGLAGSTGHSTGPHVHFEVRVNGTPMNPISYLS
jgi:murein DD-endopeptidase MepM/ murein hydrolase activator NlpD